MSKSNATTNFRRDDKSVKSWDAAISEADRLIEDAKRRIATLRAAKRGFEMLKNENHPWPGSPEAHRLLGQDSDL